MKVKRKGNANPFLSPSSCKDTDSLLKLLPVTILTLAFSLPNQDREVLAFLISRNLYSSSSSSSSLSETHGPKNKCRSSTKINSSSLLKVPLFECGCFECYTSFWHRWDSSPNRELIHQVIEAFEEHLQSNGSPRKHTRGGKKRGNSKSKRVELLKPGDEEKKKRQEILVPVVEDECEVVMVMPESNEGLYIEEEEKMGIDHQVTSMEMVTTAGANYHKGFARKVLPDVVGLLNSRLWSLWSPGI